MGDNTLELVDPGDEVLDTDSDQYHEALSQDIVPRDVNGAPGASAASVGTSLLPWLNLFMTGNFVLNGQVIDFGAVTVESHLILSGKAAVDGYPEFLSVNPASVTANILAGGINPDLSMIINGQSKTITSDLITPSMTVAPLPQNTARVNDTQYGDANFTKSDGEFGDTFIAIDTIGTEITALDGTVQAFSHGAAPECFFARVNTTNNRLEECVRGIGGTLREVMTNNDVITLLAANHIFVEIDETVYVTRTYPQYLQADPSSPTLGDFYFDTTIKRWKRYNGVLFELIEVNWLGTAILDNTETVFVQPNDFDLEWKSQLVTNITPVSTTDVKITIREANIAGIFHKNPQDHGRVYTLGSNLEPGRSEVANTLYYIYLQNDLTVFFSDLAPRKYDFRMGYYHPRRYWRCIGAVFRDGSGIESFQLRGEYLLYTNGTYISTTTSLVRYETTRIPVMATSAVANYRVSSLTGDSNGSTLNFHYRLGVVVNLQNLFFGFGPTLANSVCDHNAPIQNGVSALLFTGLPADDLNEFKHFGYRIDWTNGD